jgi:hypothetical protein
MRSIALSLFYPTYNTHEALKNKPFILLFGLFIFMSCGDNTDTEEVVKPITPPTAGVNVNANPSTIKEYRRLEMPRLRRGTDTILIHKTSNGIINYITEWDYLKKSQRWSCYVLDKDYARSEVDRYYSDDNQYPNDPLIPADSTHARFPVVIRRDASLRSATVRLRIEVGASDDFLPGVNEENHLTFIWSDKLTMPANWPDLEEFFGAYSDTKYRFMLENSTPGTTFSIETMSWAMLMSYKIKFQNAVRTYNAAHPGNALTDENGNLVTFE